MIKMNKRLLLLGFVFLLLLSLCSCQLAREDGMNIQMNDRLVGVYITQEYLDLFDFDRYLNDNIHTILNRGEITVSDNEQYSTRIYAELKNIKHIDEETSEEFETWEYEFKDLEGIPFFQAKIKQPDGNSYSSSFSDAAISDGHISIGKDTALDGTIYIASNETDITVYINPVYQSSDGRIYLTSGSGMSFSGDVGEGTVFSTTLDEKHTVTENGETTEESFKVTVKLAVKHPPLKVSIIQMDSENTPVSKKEYSPISLPENVVVDPDAEYVIVETRSNSLDGEALTRELFDPADQCFISYITRNDGICEAKTVYLQWN
jgi:hypothetical protein